MRDPHSYFWSRRKPSCHQYRWMYGFSYASGKIRSSLLHFKSDSVIDLEKLKAILVELGYERVGQVELPGQFSVRGGIIDIYPLTEENPWRIELWDDEIDSIRALMLRARDPWKMQMRSPFIRLWRKTTVRIWYLFWIIFRRKNFAVSG